MMSTTQRDVVKVRLHDAIVGILYLGSAVLALQFDLRWVYLALGVAVLQIMSPVTKFCPVYAVLNKLMPDTTPIQNGR